MNHSIHSADRATHLPAIRASLAPLRTHLQKFPFLGGSAPNFADYIALGGFYWAASAGTLPLLERDDSLRDWLDRGFNLYGGIARDPRHRYESGRHIQKPVSPSRFERRSAALSRFVAL